MNTNKNALWRALPNDPFTGTGTCDLISAFFTQGVCGTSPRYFPYAMVCKTAPDNTMGQSCSLFHSFDSSWERLSSCLIQIFCQQFVLCSIFSTEVFWFHENKRGSCTLFHLEVWVWYTVFRILDFYLYITIYIFNHKRDSGQSLSHFSQCQHFVQHGITSGQDRDFNKIMIQNRGPCGFFLSLSHPSSFNLSSQ